jgi:predicted nucleotidyltransferase
VSKIPCGLTPAQLSLICVLLRTVFAKNPPQVYAFGSRVSGGYKQFSDLDLLFKGGELTLAQLSLLKEKFEESDLPFSVALVGAQS